MHANAFWPGSHTLSCSRLPIFLREPSASCPVCRQQGLPRYTLATSHQLGILSWTRKARRAKAPTPNMSVSPFYNEHSSGACPRGSLSRSQKWVQIGPCCFVETSISELCYENQRGTPSINSFLFIPYFPLLRPTQL